jgi:hypothetical protein
MFKVPDEYRIRTGAMGSTEAIGNNGAFSIPYVSRNYKVAAKKKKPNLIVIASDQEGWEHVSISLKVRDPSWLQMCFIKEMFWDEYDCVVQYHPPKSDYVNHHPHCLHLWRPTEFDMPRPPSIFVGPKDG